MFFFKKNKAKQENDNINTEGVKTNDSITTQEAINKYFYENDAFPVGIYGIGQPIEEEIIQQFREAIVKKETIIPSNPGCLKDELIRKSIIEKIGLQDTEKSIVDDTFVYYDDLLWEMDNLSPGSMVINHLLVRDKKDLFYAMSKPCSLGNAGNLQIGFVEHFRCVYSSSPINNKVENYFQNEIIFVREGLDFEIDKPFWALIESDMNTYDFVVYLPK